jgi:hypothetical protein
MDHYETHKKRAKKSDKAKKNFEIHGKYSSKGVRASEKLQEKRAEKIKTTK